MLSYNLIHFKVMATKVYTSNEFKRERDNFSSLCKVAWSSQRVFLSNQYYFPQNLERTDTKKWLNEVMDVLFRWILNFTDDGNGDVDDYSYVDTYDINLRDRNAEEKKEEAKRLEEVS